jgi:hypothetical protein
MDEEGTQNIFKDHFKKLPPELQKAVMANDLRQKLVVLTQKYRLHIDKAGVLENEVVLVLMGLENPDEFVNNARRELGLSPEDARGLARDVNDQIFHPIRETLESFINIQAAEYAAANPGVATGGSSAGEGVKPAQNIPSAPISVPNTPSLGQAAASFKPPIGTPKESLLPEKVVDPLPALPKDIIADKLRPVVPKAPMAPATPTPAPARQDAALSMKSFGIQIERKDNAVIPNVPGLEEVLPKQVAGAPTMPPAEKKSETPPSKPTIDPYREQVG